MLDNLSPVRVKFLSMQHPRVWRRQLPDEAPIWGNCIFSFDPDERHYDWLVVYDDLPRLDTERRSMRVEQLNCSKKQTVLVTSEPSSIKSYFTDYTDQFGTVITSQPQWALPHPHRIFQQPALQWFYGISRLSEISLDKLREPLTQPKTKMISTVGTSKRESHTLHRARYEFLQKAKELVPGLDVFGREDLAMDDKAESIQRYRFHLAIENHLGLHHWTEKLADVFLGEAVPLYIGCPNIEEYFPKESYIALDIRDPDSAIATINSLTEKDYQDRIPYVLEAKRRVIEDYNIFSVLDKHISSAATHSQNENHVIMSRRQTISKNTFTSLKHLSQKFCSRLKHRFEKLNLTN